MEDRPRNFCQRPAVQPQILPQQPPSQTSPLGQLLAVDPLKKLSIWSMDPKERNDPIVEEYIKLAIKYPFPNKPSAECIALYKTRSDELPIKKETQVQVINLLHTYFQELYFIQNVGKATEHEVTLFHPQTRFFIPNYTMMPSFYFEKVKDLKSDMVLAIQIEAIQAKIFNTEYNLFRIYDLISNDLGGDNKSMFDYVYTVCYETARKNFRKVFPMKKINWEEREGKVHGSLPKWRKEGKPTPKSTSNRYSAKLAAALEEGKIKLSAITINTEFESIFKTAQNTEVKNLKHDPPPNKYFRGNNRKSGRTAAKLQRVEKPKASRPKNPHFNKGRNINEMEVVSEEENS